MQRQLFGKCNQKLAVLFNQPGTATLFEGGASVCLTNGVFRKPANIIFELPPGDAQGAEITHLTLQRCHWGNLRNEPLDLESVLEH